MSSGQCQGVAKLFDQKVAKKDRKRYQKKGPSKTTRLLINALKDQGIEGKTLLDIGGGIGAIQHELLNAGIQTATHVDASPAYLAASKAEAEARGHADRVRYYQGNFVDLAPELDTFDAVTLDRVICCFDDMRELVGRSVARAGQFYGLVYPRDRRSLKIAMGFVNFVLRLLRNPFRSFVHATREVDQLVRENGLTPCFYARTLIWQVVLYSR